MLIIKGGMNRIICCTQFYFIIVFYKINLFIFLCIYFFRLELMNACFEFFRLSVRLYQIRLDCYLALH